MSLRPPERFSNSIACSPQQGFTASAGKWPSVPAGRAGFHGSSYSAGQVKSGQYLGGAEPDYELARYAVALPILLGSVWPHIARGDHRRDAEEFARILRQLGFTLHLHEGVRRFLQIRAQRGPRIASQRPGLGGLVEGVEDDAAVLDGTVGRALSYW
jgi:hypothetical protein